MKNKLLYQLRSKVRLKITGRHIEHFIHKLATSKIEMLNIKQVKKDTVYIWINKNDYPKVCSLKTIYDVSVVDASGWIKIKKTINVNKYLLFSFGLGLALLIYLTNLVFEIEVIYNVSEVREFIELELKKRGVSKYKFKKNYEELSKIKQDILNTYKDKIEWLEIENKGVKYIVRLQLRELATLPNNINNRNLIASKDAVVKKIIAKNGQVVKDINTYVKKGDTIISGEIMLNDTLKGYVPALGQVFGEVWYQMNVEYPFSYYEEKYTGRKKNVLSFKFLNWSFDLFSFNKFKEKKTEEKILWENTLLPIKLVYEKQKEIEIIDQVLTEEETIDEAIKEARRKMEAQLTDEEYIISQKNLKINIKDSKIVLEVFFVVYEDITDYEEIIEIPEKEIE